MLRERSPSRLPPPSVCPLVATGIRDSLQGWWPGPENLLAGERLVVEAVVPVVVQVFLPFGCRPVIL
jgi:hypothetical protein